MMYTLTWIVQVTPGLCNYWEVKLAQAKQKNPEAPKRTGIRALDLFVWAVFLGDSKLSTELLTVVQEPIRAAIIGARLCKFSFF